MKPCKKLQITNKTMAIRTVCPVSKRSLLVETQSDLAVPSTNHDRSLVNGDLNSLQQDFLPLGCCGLRDIHELRRDKGGEDEITQRLSSLKPYSAFESGKNISIDVKCEYREQKLFLCLFRSFLRTLLPLLSRSAFLSCTRKQKLTFYNFFISTFFIHLFLVSMATASGVWW